MSRLRNTALLSAAMIAPLAIAPVALSAQDRQQQNARNYHDKDHNDDHHWNSHEDQAYRMCVKQNHRRSTTFTKLKDSDQQACWGWRHEHSDEVLKIRIR